MKNEIGLHMVGWMVLAQVTDGWMAAVSTLISLTYACIGLYECWRDRK